VRHRICLLIALSVWIAAPSRGQEKLAGGPYVVNVGPRSATVVWLVERGQVTLGTEPGRADKTAPWLRAEKATFTGLKAGTRYYYDVLGRDEGKGSFETAPTGPVPFQFVVYGDTRTRHDVHRKVISAILSHSSPDFVLHTGDLVENGADPALWPIFFDAERELLRKVAFFPSLGNHERNDRLYYDFLDASASYYSFNWGSSHFIVLDSDINNVSKMDSARQVFWDEEVRWLEDDLKASQLDDFRFVIAHHPPMTAVLRRQGDNPHMTALIPLFEKYKVTAGFFGHDHNYQHYLKNGVHYFITGGGGAPLYDVSKPPAGITVKVESVENFLRVKVEEKKVRLDAIRPDGSELDSTEIVK